MSVFEAALPRNGWAVPGDADEAAGRGSPMPPGDGSARSCARNSDPDWRDRFEESQRGPRRRRLTRPGSLGRCIATVALVAVKMQWLREALMSDRIKPLGWVGCSGDVRSRLDMTTSRNSTARVAEEPDHLRESQTQRQFAVA